MFKENLLKNGRPPSVFFMSTEALKACEDLINLPYLYDETVVDCITARHKDDLIYTWAGPILVAVNPVKTIEKLYSQKKIKEVLSILKDGNDHLDPHVFSVAGLAQCRLSAEIGLINQTILVSGESGAGKTESAKFLLTYLTQVESENTSSPLKGIWKGQKPQDIQRRVLASNPILEAFGNASTLRNYNSSRFGKFIRLQYNGNRMKGAMIDTYLLEKTRVTNQPYNERNFHIFYQLLSGIRNDFLPDLEIRVDDSFLIIPGYSSHKSNKDLAGFRDTLEAFHEIGVPSSEQKEIFQVVAAIMYLGNISFELNSDKEAWILSSSRVTREALLKASQLLSLPVEALTDVFIVRKIVVTTRKENTVFNKVCEREDQCKARKDSLMQLLYASVFAHLVATINSKTSVSPSFWSSYLGILDIYGFEVFEENSLEQLCINYANERLQQEFTRRYIASEHQLLIEEGFIEFPFIYSDNLKCVAALDSPISVFAILNEECQLRKALNEDETCERVCNALQETGVVAPTSSHEQFGFLIKHYAGDVAYASSGLLYKNKDEVPRDIIDLLAQSENKFVVNLPLRKDGGNSTGKQNRRGKRKITTLSKFKGSLDSLMKILTECDLHYVRCLKPNADCVSGNPDKPFLIDQLKTNGILETVKISQAGYPVRMFYADFVKRYNFRRQNFDFDEKELSFIVLLDVLGSDPSGSPPEEKCRFGKNRIFLSESGLHKLEEMRELRKNLAATCIQKNFKKYVDQRRYRTTLKAIMTLQRAAIAWLCRQRYLRLKRSAINIQKTVRCFLERSKYEKTLNSLKVIQKHCRGWLCRRKYALLLLKNARRLTESIYPPSRMSFTSSCYGSLPPTSLTDYSMSDTEWSVNEESLRVGRRLLETEESGIETDTESLSGEGLKAGRASRLRTRHDHSYFRTRVKGSDDDVNDSPSAAAAAWNQLSLKSRFPVPQRKSSGIKHPQGPSKACRIATEEEGKGERKKRKQTARNDLREVSKMIRENLSFHCLQLHSSALNVPLFYKDGVLSYRHLAKGKIRFHTRSTCLPYSTCIPMHEKPQGLTDAIR